MSDLSDDKTLHHTLQKVVQRIDPQATLLRAWSLTGGLSAQMIALEIALPPTPGHAITRHAATTRKLIVRRAGERTLRRNPQAMEQEFAILQIVQQVGVMAPRPLLLDSSATLFPDSYIVLDYIEGEPNFTPADPLRAVEQMATQLARLHQVRPDVIEDGTPGQETPSLSSALSSLPRRSRRLTARLRPPAQLDESMQEGEIRAALAGFVPQSGDKGERLLHGDFWPGNLLWREGELVAIIDWENAALGNPLEDFAIARLDVSWFFGEEARHHFSETYRAALGDATRPDVDFEQLPYWDLFAALAPTGRIAEWAEPLAACGRPDMTEAHMRAAHRRFVEQALAALGR